MSQSDFIKDIAKYGLENDQDKLLAALEELIVHSRKAKKINFALQLQSILKDSIRQHKTSSLTKVGSVSHITTLEEKEMSDFVLEKVTSDYKFDNLICSEYVIKDLQFFIKEHQSLELLQQMDLPVANKVIFHGPSGCGKTLASYVLAGELEKLLYVINLGAIVSSKLGETSKNLAKVFRKAASENSIIFLDEFDSLGKVRDYNQDHGEMKRVVNTILQLFDFMPQNCIVIAATNQINMIDDALLRRFDVNIKFDLPSDEEISRLISLTLKSGNFQFQKSIPVSRIVKECKGLSYYSIQKTLITAIKRSLFESINNQQLPTGLINYSIWNELAAMEKTALLKTKPRRRAKILTPKRKVTPTKKAVIKKKIVAKKKK